MADSSNSSTISLKLRVLTQVEGPLQAAALPQDLFLQQSDGVNQLLRTRGASRNVDIDRDDLIDALQYRVVVENSARRGAGAHGDDPFGLRHLLPEPANHR